MISFEETPYAIATEVGLRGDGDEVNWRKLEVIWHERRRDHAAILAVTDSYSYKYERLHLLLRHLDGEWFPVEQASNSSWIAYEHGGSTGVYMRLYDSICQTNQRVRFRCGARVGEAKVNAGYLCVVRWDVKQNLAASLEFLKVKVGKHWVSCVTSEVPASPAQFGDAYLSVGKDFPKHVWADSALRDRFEWEYRLKLVMAVVRQARLPQDRDALGSIGAGPLEDMMSGWLLDQLEPHLPFNDALRHALANVRMEFEPDALQERLASMLRMQPSSAAPRKPGPSRR